MTGEFPAQKSVTRKMFPFDDAIMETIDVLDYWHIHALLGLGKLNLSKPFN